MKKNMVFLFVLLSFGSPLVAMDFNILDEVFDDIFASSAKISSGKIDDFAVGNSDNGKIFLVAKIFQSMNL